MLEPADACRLGFRGLELEYGVVPPAMLAAPRAKQPPDAEGHPAHRPKSKCQQRKEQVQGMIQHSSHKELLMTASGAMRANFVSSHPLGTSGGGDIHPAAITSHNPITRALVQA